MSNLVPWLYGLLPAIALVAIVWYMFRRPRVQATPEDTYQRALELWLDGELEEATSLLRMVVHDDPHGIEPFLQLGNLLRLQGDAKRAAVLHRGLTVRPGLTRAQKITVGLALSQDLLALQRFAEAGEVLDTLARDAVGMSTYWKARFLQWHGLDQAPEAARALKQGMGRCPRRDQEWFEQAYSSYQLDRCLFLIRDGRFSEVKPRLRDVKDIGLATGRATLVQAILAAASEDPAAALTVAADGLLDRPVEMSIFLPVLQDVLLQSGQYARTIPVLERACQAENSPASLWIDLALLYEKVGDRDKAFRLLESKAAQGGLTPDVASPFLRLLADESPESDFSRVWRLLSRPAQHEGWTCGDCSHHTPDIRWFCPSCHGFNTFQPGRGSR